MIYQVQSTSTARRDLKGIYSYIADVLLEPVIAERQYSRIEEAIYSLDSLPERFRRYEKEPWRSRNLRIMPVDKYLVFYTVDNENHIVSVIRIMHGSRDIENQLDQTMLTVD